MGILGRLFLYRLDILCCDYINTCSCYVRNDDITNLNWCFYYDRFDFIKNIKIFPFGITSFVFTDTAARFPPSTLTIDVTTRVGFVTSSLHIYLHEDKYYLLHLLLHRFHCNCNLASKDIQYMLSLFFHDTTPPQSLQ